MKYRENIPLMLRIIKDGVMTLPLQQSNKAETVDTI
jgi:hypothetical protein